MASTTLAPEVAREQHASARRTITLCAIAAVVAPVTIVLHESGHFLAGLALGMHGVRLHFASVSSMAAAEGAPAWQRAAMAGAGPAVTLAIVLACCVAIARSGPRPLLVATALVAGMRSLAICVVYLRARVIHPGAPLEGSFDEVNAARGFGLSPELVIGASIVVLAAAFVFIVRRLPHGGRAASLGAVVLGGSVGIALYLRLLGPMILR
jgi:hypothetical protein